ncbi:MAG TPA: RNHCP domain-containing protein [Thermomicrobiales bacterium]|nr:RNHCP domain-containing protein [Thermomicrobiales bacterium]
MRYDDWQLDDEDELEEGPARRRRGGHRAKPRRAQPVMEDEPEDGGWESAHERRERERRRATISEPFKCRNCRAFIGEPPSGGRQRNHCPMCLYSLHVDLKTPGDRASDCRSLMEPIGVFYRPSLEQMVVHRCLGCGAVRYNRVAADDNPILLAELPVIDPATIEER